MYRWLALPLIALILTCSACAPSVTARRMVPAAYPIAGIHTLAIRDFTVAGGSARAARRVQRALERKLRGEPFYRIADEGASDALLSGRVSSSFTSRRTEEKVTEEKGTGRYRDEVYYEDGQRKTRRVEIKKTVTRAEPTVVQRAEVVLNLTLVRLPEEQLLTEDRIDESEEKRATGDSSVKALPSANRMWDELADAVAARAFANLVPHTLDYTIRYEQDDSCTEGIKRAKDGDMAGALASWRAVQKTEPRNSAAVYNEGVALEAHGDYEEARRAYVAAQAIASKKRYAEAIERIDRAIADRARLQRQMEGRSRAFAD